MGEHPLVVFDVDGVLTNGLTDDETSPDWGPRAGIRILIQGFLDSGFDLAAWSANGADHGLAAAQLTNSHDCFTGGFHPKPPERPITVQGALAVLGRLPVLTIDDKDEPIPGVPLLRLDSPMSP